jgi:alpha-L-rhamnosidase
MDFTLGQPADSLSFQSLVRILLLGTALLMAACFHNPGLAQEALSPSKVENLLCEYQTNPMGIDTLEPRFSWQMTDTRRGARQTAYQILISDDLESLSEDRGRLWDTHQAKSEDSVNITCPSFQPEAGRIYYWKVRIWDQEGKPSAYSEPASWEMGLLRPPDWKAEWIAVDQGQGEKFQPEWGDWIWAEGHLNEENSRILFIQDFEVDKGQKIKAAPILAAADDEYDLYLNGTQLGRGTSWKSVASYDALPLLQEGGNVLAIEARNHSEECGLLFGMLLVPEVGERITIKSDVTWKVSDQTVEGWNTPSFKPDGWKQAVVVAPYNNSTWGEMKAGYVPRPPRLARKDFNLGAPIQKARAYVSALGTYDLFLNGERVGNQRLAPEWTDYATRVQYQTYDVTPLLKEGANTVGMMVGNAWWGSILMGKSDSNYESGPFRALCQIEVQYADGRRETIASDASWKSHASPILSDSLYHGETYDSRLELPGWNTPGCSDSDWDPVAVLPPPKARLISQQCEPIQATEELKPVSVSEPSPGSFVFDMGQNMAGVARLMVNGPAGTTVRLRFAEVLKDDGNIYTDNYRGARCTDSYTLKGGGVEIWEPRFTYRGFRYVEVTGYPGRPDKEAITGVVFHTAVRRIGEFECSNALINQIQKNITWGIRGNLHSIPTDCPQRDERLGWAGDAQAISWTANRNFDMARFFSKWITDLADSQNPEEGWVTDVAPSLGWGPASPAWGDALVIVPWAVYQDYGDLRIIQTHYDAMAKWIDYMEKKSEGGLYNPEHMYGDWVGVVESPKEPISSAYRYYSTSLMAKMAKILGRASDENRFKAMMMRTWQAYNTKFFQKDKNDYEGETQATKVIPLRFGLVPEDRAKAVAANVVKDIRGRDFHLSTGFLGTACLMPVLTQWGDPETLWKVATQESYPSWGHMVKKGATTIWELWNSDTAGPGMNSRNHYALGAVGQWYYQCLAGIDTDPDHPGYNRIIFRPTPLGDLEWAKASIDTRYGKVSSSWTRGKDGFHIDLEVPPNTTASLALPTFGKNKPTINEGDAMVLSLGKPSGKVPGITYEGPEEERAVFSLAAGKYSFLVMP